MKQGILKLVAAGCLTAVFVSGCHKPTFEHMEPTSIKWSMSIISQAQGEEEQQRIEQLTQEIAGKQGLSADVVDAAKEDVRKLATRPGLDLVLASADTPQILQAAKDHPQLRFSLLGDSSQPQLSNVRHLVHDRNKLLFLAGFIAATANRTSNEPFSVLVREVRSADDSQWQMIVAGMHYAGRTDVPLQVPYTALNGAEPVLKGLSVVLLDPLTEEAWQGLGASGQWIVRTDERPSAVPLQDRVIAEPASLYEAALEQEAALLVSGNWTGEQKVTVAGKKTYEVKVPTAFSDAEMDVRLELIEEQMKAGSLQPEEYVTAERF